MNIIIKIKELFYLINYLKKYNIFSLSNQNVIYRKENKGEIFLCNSNKGN